MRCYFSWQRNIYQAGGASLKNDGLICPDEYLYQTSLATVDALQKSKSNPLFEVGLVVSKQMER